MTKDSRAKQHTAPERNKREFIGLPPEQSDPLTAAAAIVPVPYGATCTWVRGAERGPEALLVASDALETWDIENDWEPCTAGIATLQDIDCGGPPVAVNDAIDRAVSGVLERDQIPVVIGGEHGVSYGAIRAVHRRYPGLTVLQIDAHADLRDEYLGSPFNHACVMARVRELCPVTQVGLRAIDKSEHDVIDRSRTWYAHEIIGATSSDWMERVVDTLGPEVYVTIDLDAFDPSLVPATGTPEPGGLGWYDVVGLVDLVARRRRVVAFDVVELSPLPGQHASDFLAAKLVYRVLGSILPRP